MRPWTWSVRAATRTNLVPQAVSPSPSKCRCRVGLGAGGEELAGGAVEAVVAGLGLEQRGDDLAVGVEHAAQVGVGPRARPVGIERARGRGPGRRRARGGGRASCGEHVGVGEVAVAAVEVVVAAHRPLRRGAGRGRSGEAAADGLADQVPDERVGEFGFDPAGAAVDADERLVERAT